ncbi:hypothetical protein M413DRAFT_449382 [Hebeloma cylindrosporum]|uniref:Uncharacterized protein n=1 Tax=Hebeloma cylindrosporum TaxID=76867 RepID=A0A0C3BVF4_HEBCY|nr:hypothetical protein M413DRAFT_449382 [Hebeloma cylindrosporum h7]
MHLVAEFVVLRHDYSKWLVAIMIDKAGLQERGLLTSFGLCATPRQKDVVRCIGISITSR